MPRRQPEDWGVPLWEAIERWTPQDVWQRYRTIAKADIPLFFLENPDPLGLEACGLRGQIEHILTDKLRRGELIASGLPLPLDIETRRRDISLELWSCLKLDILHEEASGDGLRVSRLRFRRAAETRSEQAPATFEDIEPGPKKPPGRPSVMSMIEVEMRRRAANEQIESSLRRESEVLAGWARREFSGSHVPKQKTFDKRLGRVYRELKTTKRPDKMND
jgi:hypothetical protein